MPTASVQLGTVLNMKLNCTDCEASGWSTLTGVVVHVWVQFKGQIEIGNIF